MNDGWIAMRLARRTNEAHGIVSFELEAADGSSLPPFDAGAHIDIETGPGLVRQYSLCPPSDDRRYLVAVLEAPDSRGGSRAMHALVEGASLRVRGPRNLFPLAATATRTVLVAGGIGITPLLTMAEQLARDGQLFELHYAARARDRAAFHDRLARGSFADRVQLYFDDEGARIDPRRILASPAVGSHVYVCGPLALMDAVLACARELGWPEESLHRESFGADVVTGGASFSVEIASTRTRYEIPADATVVSVLAEHGIEVPVSCEQGVCGTCLTGVLAGIPDHRDSFMTPTEHAANDQFTPCCSRAKSPLLVLDL